MIGPLFIGIACGLVLATAVSMALAMERKEVEGEGGCTFLAMSTGFMGTALAATVVAIVSGLS